MVVPISTGTTTMLRLLKRRSVMAITPINPNTENAVGSRHSSAVTKLPIVSQVASSANPSETPSTIGISCSTMSKISTRIMASPAAEMWVPPPRCRFRTSFESSRSCSASAMLMRV